MEKKVHFSFSTLFLSFQNASAVETPLQMLVYERSWDFKNQERLIPPRDFHARYYERAETSFSRSFGTKILGQVALFFNAIEQW
ncbi:hypothetical protein AMTR_s00105p00078170 [Amborella trichopoda]|uniref:Uncharacterized protein n=1 Tax=Amborella trichopoda TaxID=13333 RepID=W1NSG7_AMBTC|nr:hypothetical protein AMTR_s00105p00078170 [Amborella trichopoda]